MYLDVFDRRIVDSLRARAMTLAELVRDTGYARSTVIIRLERLRSEELVLREKKPGERRGRPRFTYSLAETIASEAASPPDIVVLEFSRLRKACRYEKGGYCKLAKNTCATQNCKLTIKPK